MKINIVKKFILINLLYPMMKKINGYNVLSDEKTLEYIFAGYSISRFGDGEFDIMSDVSIGFQSSNALIKKNLYDIVENIGEMKLLLCIPRYISDCSGLSRKAEEFWKMYFAANRIPKVFKRSRVYGNTNFTRFYMDFMDKNDTIMSFKIENIRKIWLDKDVILVEGEKSRNGVGNGLFNNAHSIKRIICPSINAYDKKDLILKSIENNAIKNSNSIILLTLGPTATVLSYELCKMGYQAIDLGHLDIEYEWFLRKTTQKIPIEGKYVNEVEKKYIDVSESALFDYRSQIIDVIC